MAIRYNMQYILGIKIIRFIRETLLSDWQTGK